MPRKLFLDLDGVMANFDAHFPALFGVSHKDMLDDDMWAKINAHDSYFFDMPLMDGAVEFFEQIKHLDPIILTACPKTNYQHVARQKRQWVRKNLSEDCLILPVMGGRNKGLFCHAQGDVLIDDFERNLLCWGDEGGIGILHTNFETTTMALRNYYAF